MDTLYRLSYETRGPKNVPTLIINIRLEDFEKALPLLKRFTEREPSDDTKRYLHKRGSFPFRTSEASIGYRECGEVEHEEDRVKLVFPLRRAMARETSASIYEIFSVLSMLHASNYELVAENSQLFTLYTRYGFGDHYSHAIVGYQSPKFEEWLEDYYQSHPKVKVDDRAYMSEIVCFPDFFMERMALAWKSLSDENPAQKGMDGVGGWVRDERLFTFVCPGNAASAGIYPNERKISSHNVWAPEMQLTLLIGLFSLFEFILKHPDARSAP
jgi:hypothetical protein